MSWSCVSIRWFSSWIFYVGLMCSYGSPNRTEFNFGWAQAIVAWVEAVFLDVYLFLLKYFARNQFLWLFWRSLWLTFYVFTNVTLKGKLSSVPSFCINNYLTPLLLSPHPIQSYFRYGIYEFLGVWNNLVWYCWLVFLFWYCWLLFMCWCFWLVFLWVC